MVLKSGSYYIQSSAYPALRVGIGKGGFLVTGGESTAFEVTEIKEIGGRYVMTVPGRRPGAATLFIEADGTKVIAHEKPNATFWEIIEIQGEKSYAIAFLPIVPYPAEPSFWTVFDDGPNFVQLAPGPVHLPNGNQKFEFIPLEDGE